VSFYGYKHWTLEEPPRCFNVGKGLRKRPTSSRSRSHKWHAIVKRYGLRVEICIGPTTNAEACTWETEQIDAVGTFSTNHSHDDPNDIGCNFTRGGEGVIGRKHDEATRQRISMTMRGRKVSDIVRMNMQRAQSKRSIVQYDLQGNVIASYPSQAEAERSTGNAASNISKCCRRKAKSIGGFVWRYEDDRFEPKTPAVLTEEHCRKISEAAMKRYTR